MDIISFKNRAIDLAKPVQIYRNLSNKVKKYSVRQSGKVVAHTNEITLKDCKFVVNLRGWAWTVKHKRKTVHAYVEGFVIRKSKRTSFVQVYYNPYVSNGFISFRSDGNPILVKSAKYVHVGKNGIFGDKIV